MSEQQLKSGKLYVPGVILIIAGYLISLNPYWWVFGTPLVFIAGVTLIWISERTLRAKVLFTILPFVFWLPGFWLMIYWGTHHETPQTFLIPKNFRGNIILYSGEPCGEELKKENGRYIYAVPQSGIMIIKNPSEDGIIDQQYYFVNDKGQKTLKIERLDQTDFNDQYTVEKNNNEPDRKKIAVFLIGGGTVEETGSKGYKFDEIFVGSYNDFNNPNINKSDSADVAALKKCRN